jgi:ATP-binding protein involved in chromosome partitioning
MTEALMHSDQIEERALSALRRIATSPEGPDVVAAGHVYDVVGTDGVLRVLLDPERVPAGTDEALAEAVTSVLRDLPGVERVVVKPRPRAVVRRAALPGVRHVLAVHSGKGGVGKSTVAVNLAVALAAAQPDGQGLRVGLLDADVYGPSAPLLLGLGGRARPTADGARIAPMRAHGVTVMSLGFLMPQGKPLAWRGALVDEGLPQLLTEVEWGDLDVLIVDLPPGTSNVHLALAEGIALSGVLTVTAPGQISVQDVRRGMEMFADLAVPCLGLVENFAGVTCRRCGTTQALFGAGGGEKLAAHTGLPLLARIPFLPDVLRSGESGTPVAVSHPESEAGRAFRGMADTLVHQLAAQPTGVCA